MKLGFIGCGNMASAMISGIIKNEICGAEDIFASDAYAPALENAKETLKIQIRKSNREVAAEADVLFLSVKPQYYQAVIEDIKGIIKEQQIIVTIAPGKTLSWLGDIFEKPVKIIRCMPNTPALVGEGITGVCHNELVTEEELDCVCRILRGFGKAEVLSERLMDVVVSVSGSSPAYVFILIEAMADAAVSDGMPRAQAYQFAAQAVYGSAKMVLETKKHPGELKDMVCSPGGTTIEAVRVLEKHGLRSTIFEAMKACTNKAKGL